MAVSHHHRRLAIALALLAASAPNVAQTAPATNSTTPATSPPAAPATDPALVGPPQLRDFNLNGTVTQRAEPATPPPRAARTPAPAPPSGPSTSSPRARAGAARASDLALPQPAPTAPRAAPRDRDRAASSVTVALAPSIPADNVAPGFSEIAPSLPPSPVAPFDEGASIPWPWLLAALVAALGGGLLLWRRHQGMATRHGAHRRGLSESLAQAAPSPSPRVATPARAAPPQPTLPPAPVARPAAKPVNPDGIFSTRLRPKLAFELRPIRAETDADSGAALLFDVIVTNNGSAPARDVLVEGQLINAGPRQDEEITRFFSEPMGEGKRLPMIPPMGRISIKTRLTMSAEQMRPIELEGRQLFVPLVAFNALYRWSGGEDQDSASFLVGRGGDEVSKMAPFRLDQGARSWTGLGSRPHSLGLNAAV